MEKKAAAALAKSIVALCVRDNTCLEELHAGTITVSRTDSVDGRIVTPEGEVLLKDISRISDEEMKNFMKAAVDNVYSVLLHLDEPQFMSSLMVMGQSMTSGWGEPEENPIFAKAMALNLGCF